jgi:hypothetical protein
MELGVYVGIAREIRSTTGVGRAWGEGQLWGDTVEKVSF